MRARREGQLLQLAGNTRLQGHGRPGFDPAYHLDRQVEIALYGTGHLDRHRLCRLGIGMGVALSRPLAATDEMKTQRANRNDCQDQRKFFPGHENLASQAR
jgi:hypothetical protein